jgi:hypothetical protein
MCQTTQHWDHKLLFVFIKSLWVIFNQTLKVVLPNNRVKFHIRSFVVLYDILRSLARSIERLMPLNVAFLSAWDQGDVGVRITLENQRDSNSMGSHRRFQKAHSKSQVGFAISCLVPNNASNKTIWNWLPCALWVAVRRVIPLTFYMDYSIHNHSDWANIMTWSGIV